MKRWGFAMMEAIGKALVAKIHKQKRFANPNNDIHFMAREMDDWLVKGIQSLIDGTYTPRFLKRYYFADEMVDQLHLSDRILQHIILKQLKPTFAHVMHPHCYHLQGPSGVKAATQYIKQILKEKNPQYVIRADIKSFYKSIPHYELISDINSIYDDPKLQAMLKEIIINPIETPRGYKNPDHGIALRGPLSQFFSGIYLRPLDRAFDGMDVTYVRYQDDLLIFCQTARQLARCQQRMNSILKERKLSLSRKKTRIGHISRGFHFLGIQYPATQTQDNTTATQTLTQSVTLPHSEHNLVRMRGGGSTIEQPTSEPNRVVPHARTLRKARVQINQMVDNGVSFRLISSYLHRWSLWWGETEKSWSYQELLTWFLQACYEGNTAANFAAGLLLKARKSRSAAQSFLPASEMGALGAL